MIKDITLGQFFPGNSVVHKLDPRTKIILSIFYIVAIFMAENLFCYLALVLSAILLVFVSRISIKVILRSLRPLVLILIFTMILNIFFTGGNAGEEPLFEFYFVKVYLAGIIRAGLMVLRVVVLIVGTSVLLTYTTSPIMLTDAIEELLSPLKKIKVPVHEFAMMMTIALRFIPTLIEETDKIMSAQKARGADFSSGGLIRRAKALVPILVPLFVSSFKRADDLATAMECRCYRGDKNRTKLVKLSFKKNDFIMIFVQILFLGVIIALSAVSNSLDGLEEIGKFIFYTI